MNDQLEDLLKEMQALKAEVKELKENKPVSKYETPWYEMSKYIEQQLDANISHDTAFKYKIKNALNSLIGKSFRKGNVMNLESNQCEEAKKFIDFVVNFMKENRDRAFVKDAPQGYERKPVYKI
jgi:hypothetical protein